jgi:GNAT superfamily N-acetyltransferase
LDLYRHLVDTDPAPDPVRAQAAFRAFHAYAGSCILLALQGDQPVATCALVIVPNLTRQATPYALIENVVTHAGHRNQGHGKAVLADACTCAWAAGCYKVMLLTGSNEAATLQFYHRAGFAQTKTGFQIRRPT